MIRERIILKGRTSYESSGPEGVLQYTVVLPGTANYFNIRELDEIIFSATRLSEMPTLHPTIRISKSEYGGDRIITLMVFPTDSTEAIDTKMRNTFLDIAGAIEKRYLAGVVLRQGKVDEHLIEEQTGVITSIVDAILRRDEDSEQLGEERIKVLTSAIETYRLEEVARYLLTYRASSIAQIKADLRELAYHGAYLGTKDGDNKDLLDHIIEGIRKRPELLRNFLGGGEHDTVQIRNFFA